MEIVKETLENAIGRAEECRLLTNNPAGLRIHIEYISDLMKSLIKSGYEVASTDENENELLAAAMKTLKNLRRGVTAAKPGTSPPILELRAEIEKNSGQKLHSFDGVNDKFSGFLDTFSILLNSDVDIGDVLRLIVLKNCLKGVAFDLVDVLPTSARNYSFAMDLLEDVYAYSDFCITELYHTMVALPQVSSNNGPEFRQTFWELERILQSMKANGVRVNDDLYLRLLYMKKFSEETLIGVLVKDPNLSLSDIRAEIRRMVYLQELNCKFSPEKPADIATSQCSTTDADVDDQKEVSNSIGIGVVKQNGSSESAKSVKSSVNSKSSSKKPANTSTSKGSTTDAAVDEKEVSQSISIGVVLVKENGSNESAESVKSSVNSKSRSKKPANTSTSKGSTTDAGGDNQKKISLPFGSIFSAWQIKDKMEAAESDQDDSDDEYSYAPTLATVCAPVSFCSNGKKKIINVRILIQNIPPVSLLTEHAAKRLGINVHGQKKTLRLRGTLGDRFTATQTAFKITLDLGDGTSDCIKVHIVDDNFTDVLQARSVADFKKEHPHLSHLDLPDTGEGRPVDLYLSGEYWDRYIPNFWNPSSDVPPVKRRWRLTESKFGLLVGGQVKSDGNLRTYSFRYDE